MEFRYSPAERTAVIFLCIFLALIIAVLAVLTAMVVRAMPTLTPVMLAGVLICVGSLAMCIGEARARLKLRMAIEGDALLLDLPAQRGYARHEPVAARIRLADVTQVLSRVEAFRALGMTTVQVGYALVLRDGTRIVLGGDRPNVGAVFGPAAVAVARLAGVRIEDVGVVDGHGQWFMVGRKTTPDWSTPSLPADVGQKRIEASGDSWRLAALLSAIVLVLATLSLLL